MAKHHKERVQIGLTKVRHFTLFWKHQNTNNNIVNSFTVIFAIVWAGALPTQNKETAIKIDHFQVLFTVN
jgi:hypothetical protein